MSYIVSEVYETFMAAADLQRAPGGLRFIAVITVVLLALLLTAAAEGQGGGLFFAVNRGAEQLDSPVPALLDATTLRRRVVTMDLDRLQRARATTLPRPSIQSKAASPRSGRRDAVPAPDATLTLNLFEDVVFTGIVEHTAPTFSGGYSISGRLVGDSLGTLTLVVNGETVAGSVRTLDGTYRIRSVGSGLYAISEIEETPLNCGVEEPHFETDHQH